MIVFSDISKNVNKSVEAMNDEYLIVIADVIVAAAKKKKKILIIGNGGSNADAQHIAAELTDQRGLNKPSIRVVTQCSTAQMTSISNEMDLFTSTLHFIQSWGEEGDIIIFLSANDNSLKLNTLKIIDVARKKKMKIISITGLNDPFINAVDYPIEINSKETHIIQIGAMMVMHYIAEVIEKTLYIFDRKNTELMM